MAMDGLETIVLQQDYGQLGVFLHGGLEFHRVQHVIAVSEKHVDFAIVWASRAVRRWRQGYRSPCRNFQIPDARFDPLSPRTVDANRPARYRPRTYQAYLQNLHEFVDQRQ